MEENPHERLRLFFAVLLPDNVRAALARLRPPPTAPGAGAYRWVDASLLHVTLIFLGSQPVTALEELAAFARSAAQQSQPGHLALGETGSFGSRRAPRVLWTGLSGDVGALAALHATLAAGLRSAGYAVEDRPFAPHITLARRREAARSSDVIAWPPPTTPHRQFPFDRFDLMRSDLSPRGPRYASIQSFPLGG